MIGYYIHHQGLGHRTRALGIARELGVPVTLATEGGEPVDAGSALMIMTLGAGNGDAVTVESDDQAAVDTIAGLVAKDLDA